MGLPTMPRNMLKLARCPTFDRNLQFLDRLNETQFKCPQGDPFENVGSGGTVGSTAMELAR